MLTAKIKQKTVKVKKTTAFSPPCW